MVCLGNICRSPLAEGILKDKLSDKNYYIDSAGTTAYHIGRSPDLRSIEVAAKNSIDISDQKARKFEINDFQRFDKILVMDRKNLSDLKRLAPSDKAANKLSLLWENNEVPDPYYGDEDDFNAVFEIIDRACDTFVVKLLNR